MDDYFERMPCRFDVRVITMFDSWDRIINSSVYYIDNDKLKEWLNDFYQSWKDTCEF